MLVLGFEVWSQASFGASFVGNVFNLRSIAVFTVAPLLLALGQTFVIISGGIDLSVGFTMGLAAIVMAHTVNLATPVLGPGLGFFVGLVVAVLAAMVPGVVNGLLIARLRVPPFIGTLGMYGVARGVAYLLAGGTTVQAGERVHRGGQVGLVGEYLLRPHRERGGVPLGRAMASSKALVCSDWVPPSTAARAWTVTRTTFTSGCCAVSWTPAVWVWNRASVTADRPRRTRPA